MKDTKRIFKGLDDAIQQEAASAALMARTAKTEVEVHGKAIAAIVLAMAAVEARVGTWTAIFKDDYGIDESILEMWRRKSGVHKIIKNILSRLQPPVAVGTFGWYQRLAAFVELRNHCLHYYPEFRQTGTWPKHLEPYIRNGSIRPIGDDTMDWTERLLVPSVAQQAVDCAREVREQFFYTAWQPPNTDGEKRQTKATS